MTTRETLIELCKLVLADDEHEGAVDTAKHWLRDNEPRIYEEIVR